MQTFYLLSNEKVFGKFPTLLRFSQSFPKRFHRVLAKFLGLYGLLKNQGFVQNNLGLIQEFVKHNVGFHTFL